MKYNYLYDRVYNFMRCLSCAKNDPILYFTNSLPYVCAKCVEREEENNPDAALGLEVFKFKNRHHKDLLLEHLDKVIDSYRYASYQELSFKLIKIWKQYERFKETN